MKKALVSVSVRWVCFDKGAGGRKSCCFSVFAKKRNRRK